MYVYVLTYFSVLSHNLKQKKIESAKTFSEQRNNNKYTTPVLPQYRSSQVLKTTHFFNCDWKLPHLINKYIRINQLVWWLTYDTNGWSPIPAICNIGQKRRSVKQNIPLNLTFEMKSSKSCAPNCISIPSIIRCYAS